MDDEFLNTEETQKYQTKIRLEYSYISHKSEADIHGASRREAIHTDPRSIHEPGCFVKTF